MKLARMRSGAILQLACVALIALGTITAVSAARLPFEARYKQSVLERAYEDGVASGTPERPFARSEIAVAGKLVYPRLRQSLVVTTTGTEEALEAGPSLVTGTAPIGLPGTSLITAHNDTHFAFLQRARVGDTIEAAGPDGRMRSYRVTRTEVIDADDLAITMGTTDNRLALYTCYPFRVMRATDRRFVVHAELAD